MVKRNVYVIWSALAIGAGASAQTSQVGPLTVTADNFARAETDTYFARILGDRPTGQLIHSRELTPVDRQTVVRSNRDTIYSRGVFDLDAGPVTIRLPDSRGRFVSVQAVNEDHYVPVPTIYGGARTFTREEIGTRYLFLLVRIFVDPNDPADSAAVHALQDAIRVQQASPGRLEIPHWDEESLSRVRDALSQLGDVSTERMFGSKDEVNPVHHLIGTAIGWGGNPAADAKYLSVTPERNDGTTIHRLTVSDVPVDGFWSISVYNRDGFFEPNSLSAYSLNNVTATPDEGGAYTIQFGGCDTRARNCLPIPMGWNYTVRLYRPRAGILNGTWTFPSAIVSSSP